MPALTWQRADGTKQRVPLDRGELTIGRDPGNELRIDSTFVSRRHALVRRTAQGFTLADLGSANGTMLNGQPVRNALLKPGDTVTIGDQQFVFAAETTGRGGGGRWLRLAALLVIGTAGLLVVLMLVAPAGETGVEGPPAAPAEAVGGDAPAEAPGRTIREAAAAARSAPPAAAERPAPPPEAGTGQAITMLDGTGRLLRTGEPDQARPRLDETIDPIAGAAAPQAGASDEEAERLYESALAHIAGDRLPDARRLLIASLVRAPDNPSARQRLREVEATIEARIEHHLAAAKRAFSVLRYRQAILEWEQVTVLTGESDPRRAEALGGIERARARMGRP